MNDADLSGRVTEPDLLGTASAPASEPAGYRVLARKYRPATFDDLIGQDAMVRTITNAFTTGRIPQAWILTGVRGVGKTTTARILARALNYALPDGSVAGPTVRMPGLGLHCAAIMESRHFDVIEMDAASHNSVDDIRQINDAIRYAPVSARYKVYILDEVHMLSTAAFNALLKTLEEPPPHSKFIFATTEIRKVPITVLSRCQRFDLRRLDAERLMAHLEGIAAREQVTAEPDALALIARAADGSVRDALSLFDQAIAHAAGPVRAQNVQQMLGLADRSRVIDLFERLMHGDIAGALGELRDQHDSGADPLIVLSDLAEFTHFVTRVKAVSAIAEDRSLPEAERVRGRALAAALSMRTLSRTWQMLFKGIEEVDGAAKPIAAAEMVLVRIAYAADLPTPDEVILSLSKDTASAGADASQPRERPRPPGGGATLHGFRSELAAPAREARSVPAEAPVATAPKPIASFAALLALAGEQRDLALKAALERDVRLVRFEDGKLEVALEPTASKALIGDLARKLGELTNRRWMVVLSAERGEPPVKAQLQARQDEIERGVQADPLVQSVLERFPGAEIVAVRPRAEEDAGLAAVPDAEDALPEPAGEDDTPAFGARGRADDVNDPI